MLKFGLIAGYFKAIPVDIWFSVFFSIYNSGIIYGEENREPHIHWNRFETSPNAIETQVIHRRAQVSRFISSLSPISNYFVRSSYSHTNSYKYNAVTQCHVDGKQITKNPLQSL